MTAGNGVGNSGWRWTPFGAQRDGRLADTMGRLSDGLFALARGFAYYSDTGSSWERGEEKSTLYLVRQIHAAHRHREAALLAAEEVQAAQAFADLARMSLEGASSREPRELLEKMAARDELLTETNWPKPRSIHNTPSLENGDPSS